MRGKPKARQEFRVLLRAVPYGSFATVVTATCGRVAVTKAKIAAGDAHVWHEERVTPRDPLALLPQHGMTEYKGEE